MKKEPEEDIALPVPALGIIPCIGIGCGIVGMDDAHDHVVKLPQEPVIYFFSNSIPEARGVGLDVVFNKL